MPDDVIIERSSESDKSKSQEPIAIPPLTVYQIKLMVVICFINFASCASMTLLTTFLPDETVRRDVSASQNGMIFGIYAGINIFTCPLFGYLLPHIGGKAMLISGMTMAAVTCFLFSFLEWEFNPLRFYVIALIIRIFNAIGCSQYLTAAYSVLTSSWSERRSQAIGLLEMTTGLGMIVGPMLGSLLYTAGGFALPFRVMGGVFLLGVPLSIVIVKKDSRPSGGMNSIIMLSSRLHSDEYNEVLSFRQFCNLFLNPGTWATICLTVICWSGMDFIMPVLQKHMELIMNCSSVEATKYTGYIFGVLAIAYGGFTPIIGVICTKLGYKSCRPIMLLGAILIVIAYIFIGPQRELAYFFGLDKFGIKGEFLEGYMGGFPHACVCFVILGIGLAAIAVPSVEDLVQCGYKQGLPKKGVATVSIVSGFYNAILFAGEFFGPVMAGTFQELCQEKKYTDEGQISMTYFYFGLVLVLLTILSIALYGLELLIDFCKARRTLISRSHSRLIEESHRKNRVRTTSLVYGRYSLTASLSIKNK